ncbi:MAG TPA: hypothetical protein VF725_11000 [Ktedonobacterales bacterium]
MTTITTNRRNITRWSLVGAIIMAVIAAALVIATTRGLAWAAPGGPASSYWHIGYYAPSGRALSMAAAPSAGSGNIAKVDFTTQDNTALLVTDNSGQFPSLLGNLTGKSVSASFTVSGLNAGQTFTYYGEPDACGGTAVHARYFFETSNAGGFDETHYWWSHPVAATLSANGSVTLTSVPLTGANWSDYYGDFGVGDYAAGFNAAVSHVTMIGLSFGGGCFFENGVGTTDGSGSLTLNTFTVS